MLRDPKVELLAIGDNLLKFLYFKVETALSGVNYFVQALNWI